MLLALTLFAAACGPEFAVVPKGGMERIVAEGQGPASGVTMVAYANQWDAFPQDLADYVTPIAVELYNPGPNEVRVSYVDLALRDASGYRYGAINPYIPANLAESDPPAAPQKLTLLASNGPIVLASSSGGHSGGGGHFGGGGAHFGGGAHWSGGARGGFGGRAIIRPPSGPRGVVIAPGARHPGYGWGYGAGGWSNYRVIGGLRHYYGPGVGYWGGPWIYPPYYRDWVFFWGPAYYPARPSMEVLEQGLPEGVLPPGGRVSGFLYFKRATGAHQTALDLSWEMHDAQTGASLGSLHVPLEVVPR
ncbi:MAG TPA: hypothetical protein VGL86_08065 [Polyangia bacterium]|jgi:hypothetical protein